MAFAHKAIKLIKQRAFLFKLLLTIAGFICIPMVVMQIFVIGQSTEGFQKNNQEYYLSVLQNSSKSFEAQENLLSRTALQISLDELVQKPLRHNATEYSQYEAVEALNSYMTTLLHVEQIGIYYADKDYLLINGVNFITGGVKYKVVEFCAKFTGGEPAETERMVRFLTERDRLGYYAAPDGTLFAARPISLGAVGKNDAIAFFVLDTKELEQNYRTAISLHASFAIATDQGEYLIRGEHFYSDISSDVLQDFLASGKTVSTTEADELVLYQYRDGESGRTYLLSVDKNEAEQSVLDFARHIRSTMVIALVFMCIAMAVTLYINYTPLQRLLDKHSIKADGREIHSELERLDSAFFALDEQATTQQNLLMEFMLGDLLFGNTVNQELVEQYFSENQYQSYVVASVRKPSLTTDQAKILADALTELTDYSIHITRVPYRPHTVIICMSEDLIDVNLLQECIDGTLQRITGDESITGIGDMVTDFSELRSSYRGSLTVNPDPVPEASEMNSGDFSKQLQFLVQSVYVGDEAEALKHLDDIRQFIYTELSSAGLRRYYGYKVIGAYLGSINSSEAHLSGKDVEMLLSFTSTQNLFELLTESIHQVCGQVADAERSVDLQLSQRLLQYVDENFRNSDLCLTAAADHLDTSIYAVSRLFKEITGRGFKDYVTEKRLEYGHMLLCTTQNSIAEIAAAAGFENANYFSTVFKLKYGLPPTKFRKTITDNQSGSVIGGDI